MDQNPGGSISVKRKTQCELLRSMKKKINTFYLTSEEAVFNTAR